MKDIYRLAIPMVVLAFVIFAQPVMAQYQHGDSPGYPGDSNGYSNEEILNGIQERMKRQPEADLSKINVWLQDGIAYLSGTVESQQALEMAVNAANSVRGVRNVDTSQLQVVGFQGGAGDTGHGMYDGDDRYGIYNGDDRNLQNRVERALHRSLIDVSGMNVDVRNRQVNLFGRVQSREDRNIAVAVANSVEGVENVNANDLSIVSSDYSHPTQRQERGYYSEQENILQNRVYSALERTPGIDASKIDVRVNGDRVYLSGWVNTQEEKNIAHSVAHAVEGVSNVNVNDIKIQ